ncbi:ABC transporter ATP-binding protein [Shimia sp. R9_3]|uniref:ABC transporter ATP-binding protein n=1 Tax=Shimia sp. R9_3 TaxID=2821113 RepID=UPI001ADBB84B|nr:ABC transporter ATP-binding protein [Shimia sp. R9_3]MBO9402932.1 ABC transporter ATP-binding protein [Shimia sp. R9_3]
MSKVLLRNIRKSFGALEVITGVDLDIEPGEFVVFVGPSGSGKSTMLRILAGLEDATAGQIQIGDHDVTYASPSERGIAMVFQSYALYPHKSVFENIAFNLRLNKVSKAEVNSRVHEAARILRLTELLERKPSQLSGGQRQRVAIGRAIVRNPEVFLFDEPLSNLDAALRVEMRFEIEKLHRNVGATMVYVTHDQVEAMTLADRIVAFDGGRIQQIGTPLELYNHPNNLFVAGFIGSPKMNFIAATAAGSNLAQIELAEQKSVALNQCDLTGQSDLTLGIRPEAVQIGTEQTDALNFRGEIVSLEQLGHVSYAHIDYGSETPLVVQLPASASEKRGDIVLVSIAPDDFHVFDGTGQSIR